MLTLLFNGVIFSWRTINAKQFMVLSNWMQSLITKQDNTAVNISINTSSLLKRSKYKFTICLVVIAILVLLVLSTLLGFLIFTPMKLEIFQVSWPQKKFLVVSGGIDSNANFLSDVEVMGNPDDLTKLNNTCQLPPNLPDAWAGHATAFSKGHLISCGGVTNYTNYNYTNTTCLKWKPGSPNWMNGPRMWNHEWFIGGFAVTTGLGVWFIDPWYNGRTYLLEEINKDLEPGPHTHTRRMGSCVTHAFGDSVIITGGRDFESAEFLGVELYDYRMKFSKNLPPLLTPRYYHSCSSTGSLVVVAGGGNGKNYLDSVEVLDLKSPFGWKELKKLPRKVAFAVMVNLGGRLVYVGGHYPEDTNENDNIFKPAADGLETYREAGHSVVPMNEINFCDKI